MITPLILYQGLLASPASWARVGRGYLEAWLAQGVPVAAVSPRGFGHDPDFHLPAGLPILTPAEVHAGSLPGIGLGFLHPPTLDRLVGGHRANLFVWEGDRIPEAWVALLETLDQVIVPTRFVQETLVRSGLTSTPVAVVPYGYDADRLAQARARSAPRPPDSPFTFLCVAAPHWRKGLRELLIAYRSAFDSGDAVQLIVKTPYDPADSRRQFPFEIPSWNALLEECGMRELQAPHLEIVTGSVTDSDILEPYCQADVFVAPTWGEAFGLGILEAAAAGLPVITTDWGGATEFLPPGPDRVPYQLEDGGTALYVPTPGAQVARPDVDALVGRLRAHADNPEASRQQGAALQQHVAGDDLNRAARELLETLPLRGRSR